MGSKYYTPSIEEFSIGFECEMSTTPMNWIHTRITLNHFKHVDKWLKEETIRVKYLDREDIESLGFETMIDKYMIYAMHEDLGIYIDCDIESLNCKISNIDDTFLRGTIKNISELKQVLIMIGVE